MAATTGIVNGRMNVSPTYRPLTKMRQLFGLDRGGPLGEPAGTGMMCRYFNALRSAPKLM